VLDIGSRNGSYLPGLARTCGNAEITAVELDGGRRYWNGYRRADHGEAFARSLRTSGKEARYLWDDIRNLSGDTLSFEGKALITLFYPFVSEAPCEGWGLPSGYSDFHSVLSHLMRLQQENSSAKISVLSAHQGSWEEQTAREAYEKLGIIFEGKSVEKSEFAELWPSEHPVFLFRSSLGSSH
jgi:hypothetical protein